MDNDWNVLKRYIEKELAAAGDYFPDSKDKRIGYSFALREIQERMMIIEEQDR